MILDSAKCIGPSIRAAVSQLFRSQSALIYARSSPEWTSELKM